MTRDFSQKKSKKIEGYHIYGIDTNETSCKISILHFTKRTAEHNSEGCLAQLVERRVYTAMVGSSTLSAPTKSRKNLLDELEKFCIITLLC